MKHLYSIVLSLYEKDKGTKLSSFFNGNRNIHFESLVVSEHECRRAGDSLNELSILKHVWSQTERINVIILDDKNF